MAEKPEQDMNALSKDKFYIVGIGASAGGVQALKEFFENTPPDSGIAFVVILHLSPDHDSHLTNLLQTVTDMTVTQVKEKVRVQPNQVYVVPPNQHLMMEDGMLTVSVNTAVEERRAPVDIFFRTLAESHTTKAIAVILSGTGANGSMGMKRVKEKGGAVFVQNPREAEFSEMPRNSIATELVDEVLPVADIPAKILSYTQSQDLVHIPLEVTEQPQDQQQALREIFTQLRLRTGHDFSNYKRPTLLRRIERRLNIHNLPDLPAYTAYLQQHPEEITSLLKDLLISVTNFFRDKRAFEELETRILPLLFQGKKSGDQVRIWIAGCATGEEAYSMAMLCAERTLNVLDAPKVQIFATDIDETAIATAREGLYTLNDAADVSPERLRRFFTKEGDDYRIRREIREMVLFASHNFIKDPPFSHLHLISCRNVLIYLNHTAQERVMETFHFALNSGGFLFLGSSESTDTATDLYSSYSREHHIFQARQATNRTYPLPESVPSFRSYEPPVTIPAILPEVATRNLERITYGDLHQRLLEQYAPPSMVVNEEYDIIHLSERAGRYLQISGGELSRNLLKLVRQELRLELRSALYQAAQRQAPVEVQGLQVGMDDGNETLNIQVRPVLQEGDTAKGFILIIFTPAEANTPENIIYSSEEPVARHLEEELIRIKAQLRTSNEQHEFQAEELKAANEELQAMNEELRSAAEELETSKEELQSINEELTTVNQELKVKVDEVTMASSNLQNLVNSTDLGTIFLDRSFRVVLFTPSARTIFNLIPADIGRPLSDITSKLDYNDILTDAELVLDKLQAIEREVQSLDDRLYLMRILPYRTIEDRIQGVVITFIDVTERMQAEEELWQAEEKYRTQLEGEVADRTADLKASNGLLQATMDSSVDMIQVFDAVRNERGEIVDFTWKLNNYATEESYGDVIGKSLLEINPGVVPTGIFDTFKQVVETGVPDERERHYQYEQFDGWFYQSAVKLGDGVATTTSNITQRKKDEQEILNLKDEIAQKATDKYESLFNSIDEGFCIFELQFNEKGHAIDWIYTEANPAFEKQTGFTQPVGKRISDFQPNLERSWFEQFAEVARTGEPVRFTQYAEAMGIWYDVYALRVGEAEENKVSLLFTDVTERKRHELNAAFLDSVTKMLAGQSTPDELMTLAAVQIGQFFKVSACVFADVNEAENEVTTQGWMADGLPSQVKQTFRFDDYVTDELRRTAYAGEVFAINDTQHDWRVNAENYAKMGIGAVAAFHFKWLGKWTNYLAVTDTRARLWHEDEITLLQELSDRIFLRREGARSEEALRKSEEKYRTLFETMGQGYAELEIIRDPAGRAIDVRFLALNPQYERLIGIPVTMALGRTVLEIVPDLDTWWIQEYDRIVRSGSPGQLVNEWAGKWYEANLYPRGGERVSVLYEEITERKRREEQQVYLLKLSDSIRPLTDPVAIQQKAMEVIGKQLGASRAFYGDMQDDEDTLIIGPGYTDTVSSLEGQVKFSRFDSNLVDTYKQGKTVVINDVALDYKNSEQNQAAMEAIQVQAAVGVPLLKGGKVRGILSIHQSHSRQWTPFEISLIEETAERTWAAVERAKAEEQFAKELEDTKQLQQISNKLIEEDNVQALYEAIMDSAMEIMHSDFASIQAFSPEKNELYLLAYKNFHPGSAKLWEFIDASSTSSCRQAMMNRTRIIFSDIDDIAYEIGKEDYDGYRLSGIVSMQSTPLISRAGNQVGMISTHWKHPHQPSEREFNLFDVLARQTADLLEQKQAEQALKESEAQATALNYLVPVLLWRADAKGEHISLHPKWLEYTGQTVEESQNFGWLDAIHPEDRPATEEAFRKAFETGQPIERQQRIHNGKDGYRWFLVKHVPIKDDNGKIKDWFGAAIDIEEREAAIESLRISEERYRMVLESAELATWDWNILEDKVIWNEEHFTMLGVTPTGQPVPSDYFLQFIHPDDADKVRNQLYEAVVSNSTYQADFRIIREDDKATRWMSGYGKVVEIQNGQAARMVGVMSDITPRKKLEEQREDFLGFASHELKTPVTSIKAYAQILLQMFEASDDIASAGLMQKLDNQVNRLTSLISDLLDVTKIAEGQLPLHLEAFDFNDLLQERSEDLQRLSATHQITTDLCDNAVFTADRERIGQVITNFVSNAIKYSPLAKEVIIRCQRRDHEIQISVQDFGIGIPQDVQRKVFDRFFRVKETQIQNFPGLGLGLFICAGIIHRHGGHIWVESQPGEGSTFYFTLPVGK